MTNTSTQSPHDLSAELDSLAQKYTDFSPSTMGTTSMPHSFEKICSTAGAGMTLFFNEPAQSCVLKVTRYLTGAGADEKNRREHNFAWNNADAKWGEGASDFTNQELAEKLRELLVSDVW